MTIIMTITMVLIYFTFPCFSKEIVKEELCVQEIFKPVCSRNDLILIIDAKYGRMKIGKCLSENELQAFGPLYKDPQNYGCYDDVTEMLNNICKYRGNCEIKVSDLQFDSELKKSTSCFPGLIKFLEAQYSCIPVLDVSEDCKVLLPSRPIHLNPSLVPESCRSHDRSLMIEVPKGQRIKINLIELHKTTPSNSNDFPHIGINCGEIMANVRDILGGKNATVCESGFLIGETGSQTQVFRQEFPTKSHVIEISFYSPERNRNGINLMRLEVEGCLDIIPPEDAWLKRTNEDIVVGCYSSKQTWYLRCDNGKWSGTIGNCSQLSQIDKNLISVDDNNVELTEAGKIKMSEGSQIFVIIAICGFGLVICLMIVCCGLIYVNRMKRKNISISEDKMNGTMHYSSYCANGIPFNPTNRIQPPLVDIDESIDQERYQILDREEVAKESFISDI